MPYICFNTISIRKRGKGLCHQADTVVQVIIQVPDHIAQVTGLTAHQATDQVLQATDLTVLPHIVHHMVRTHTQEEALQLLIQVRIQDLTDRDFISRPVTVMLQLILQRAITVKSTTMSSILWDGLILSQVRHMKMVIMMRTVTDMKPLS